MINLQQWRRTGDLLQNVTTETRGNPASCFQDTAQRHGFKAAAPIPAPDSLHRVLHVNEPVCQPKTLRQVLAQRLHAVAPGGVVTGSKAGDAGFAPEMRGLLGNLAADIGIDTERDGRLAQDPPSKPMAIAINQNSAG